MFGFGKKAERYDEDDDFETEEEFEAAEELADAGLSKPKCLGWADFAIAGGLGFAAFALLEALAPQGLHPAVWNDCAEAAGLRPASSIVPGLWRAIGGRLFSALGVEGGCAAVALLGKAALGAIIALAYLSFKDMLSILVRPAGEEKAWTRVMSRVVSAMGSLVLLGADPVWTLGYAFGHVSLCVLLFMLTVFLLAHFLAAGRIGSSYWAMFVLGLLCAETPLGLIVLVVFWTVFHSLLNKGGLFHVQLLEPLVQQSSKWYLTFCWAAGALGGAAIAIGGFIACDGMEATGWTSGDLPLEYAKTMWNMFYGAASGPAWIIGSGATVLPFVLAIALLRRAADLEHFLSYHVGIVFFAVGMVAYSQVCAIQPLWFWTWDGPFRVGSPVMLFICSLMCATTIVCAIAVAAIDVFSRDHKRLAAQINSDIDAEKMKVGLNFTVKTVCFAAFCLLVLAGIAPGRMQPDTRRMLGIVGEYVKEIVNEAEGAKWIFTDGAFDCAIELEAAKRGKPLACLSLNPGPGRRSIYAVKKSMPDDEDRLSAEIGESNVLRTWQRDKPQRLEESAIMLGFELWRQRGGTDYPPVSGVLARTVWPSEELERRGLEAGRKIREEVMAFQDERGDPKPITGRLVRDLFYIMQWRLARLAALRCEMYDRLGDPEAAAAERKVSDALDDKNGELKRLRDRMVQIREHTLRQMPPREGLHLALVRADYIVARHYAEPILDAEPDNVDANFAMGMNCLVKDQLSLAETYLEKCARLVPGQPTFWNNLAYVQMKLGKYDKAKTSVAKALELLPGSIEIKDTERLVKEAEAAANKKSKVEGRKVEGRKAEDRKD